MTGDNVPREFIGRAREFRRRIAAAEEAARHAMTRAAMLIMSQAQRGLVTPSAVKAAAVTWRDRGPAAGRLSFAVQHGRGGLHMEECRLSSAEFRAKGWATDAAEPDVIAVRYVLTVDLAAREYGSRHSVLAAVSLHALARRYQRGAGTTDAAIGAELGELVKCPAIGREAGEAFSVPVAGGAWVGRIVEMQTLAGPALVRAARTYLDADLTPGGASMAVMAA